MIFSCKITQEADFLLCWTKVQDHMFNLILDAVLMQRALHFHLEKNQPKAFQFSRKLRYRAKLFNAASFPAFFLLLSAA